MFPVIACLNAVVEFLRHFYSYACYRPALGLRMDACGFGFGLCTLCCRSVFHAPSGHSALTGIADSDEVGDDEHKMHEV